ncbi:unnamed protein product [Rotaria sp. Silwood2]|nr:unnamed protein product [Rotaria sp. Silwood2]CAF2982603.1 unnamed protein product [Rotaria sp. Silwood2]CAF3360217.1 unnamed protein product [Rotaria sp. Silwood2]CAF3929753.1 unnamed protein product [Rotaria sp. Silwood2]CAF4083999.1 unnamed protein product [Rotaria sp. Silwood2]
MMNNFLIAIFLCLFICSIKSEWLAIDDSLITTWNETNADRSRTLTTFQVTNYPPKYIKPLRNRIDTYTYDRVNNNVYFIMEQNLYGISKFFKYNSKSNQVYQTEQVQHFMIDQIQYNDVSNKLYATIQNNSNSQFLVEINIKTLEVKRQIIPLVNIGFPMPGSYFDSETQLFTYHAYNPKQDHTVLNTLNLSNNASKIIVESKKFDFNVYGFGYIKSYGLVALWQYSIITPMVCIKLNERSGKQIRNVTITPDGIRIAEGYKPFSMDFENRLFYVLSLTDDLSTTYISKINIDTLQLKLTTIQGQKIKDYIFLKKI